MIAAFGAYENQEENIHWERNTTDNDPESITDTKNALESFMKKNPGMAVENLTQIDYNSESISQRRDDFSKMKKTLQKLYDLHNKLENISKDLGDNLSELENKIHILHADGQPENPNLTEYVQQNLSEHAEIAENAETRKAQLNKYNKELQEDIEADESWAKHLNEWETFSQDFKIHQSEKARYYISKNISNKDDPTTGAITLESILQQNESLRKRIADILETRESLVGYPFAIGRRCLKTLEKDCASLFNLTQAMTKNSLVSEEDLDPITQHQHLNSSQDHELEK